MQSAIYLAYIKGLFGGSLFYAIDHLSILNITMSYSATLHIAEPLFFK